MLANRSAASVSELSELLEIDQTTTTRNVSILEDAGLVMRVPHHDPRVKLIKLTDKGKQKRRLAAERWQEIQHRISSCLSDKQWQTFRSALDTIEDCCKQEESL
jgi:DNA-binding MarR family transcriptional regulator